MAGPAATIGSHRDLIPDGFILLPLIGARNAMSPRPYLVDPGMSTGRKFVLAFGRTRAGQLASDDANFLDDNGALYAISQANALLERTAHPTGSRRSSALATRFRIAGQRRPAVFAGSAECSIMGTSQSRPVARPARGGVAPRSSRSVSCKPFAGDRPMTVPVSRESHEDKERPGGRDTECRSIQETRRRTRGVDRRRRRKPAVANSLSGPHRVST